MKYTHVLLVVLSFVLLITHAQNRNRIVNVGVGYYGIQSQYWPCEKSYNALKDVKNIHISFLYRSFGMNNECLYKFIDDQRTKTVEVHLTNGCSVRNRQNRPYEVLSGETIWSLNKKLENKDPKIYRKFKREMDRYNKDIISRMRQDQVCLISPILESNLSGKAADRLFKYMRKIAPPQCLLVSNDMGAFGGYPNGSDLSEGHGQNSLVCSTCVNNLDGHDIDLNYRRSKYPSDSHINESQVMGYIRERANSFVNFLWISEFNGRDEISSNSDPRQRKEYPSRRLFKEVAKFIIEAQKKS